MKWKKLGLVWKPSDNHEWSKTHATCPTPILLDENRLRVFIQTRDINNIGRVSYVDLKPENPLEIIQESIKPVLDIGEPGAFDDNGVFQTSIIRNKDNDLYLYYVGFEICHNIRYRLLSGLAISKDNGETFKRISKVPILERSNEETTIRGGPFVSFHEDKFKMWYVSGSEWENLDGKEMPVYDLRYLESNDGINWPKEGKIILKIDRETEHGFGRPFVVTKENSYHMYYSVRKKIPLQYRLGYATSRDGIAWERKDSEIGLDISDRYWETESVEFGAEFSFNGKTWLFYNGNDFGKDGFAIALLSEK